jgi:hypothetical protein
MLFKSQEFLQQEKNDNKQFSKNHKHYQNDNET